MYCEYCGLHVRDEASFCPGCGTRLKPTDDVEDRLPAGKAGCDARLKPTEAEAAAQREAGRVFTENCVYDTMSHLLYWDGAPKGMGRLCTVDFYPKRMAIIKHSRVKLAAYFTLFGVLFFLLELTLSVVGLLILWIALEIIGARSTGRPVKKKNLTIIQFEDIAHIAPDSINGWLTARITLHTGQYYTILSKKDHRKLMNLFHENPTLAAANVFD